MPGAERPTKLRSPNFGLRTIDNITKPPKYLMTEAESSSPPSYYDILQVPRSATGIDLIALKSAYRRLLLEHHPDKIHATSEAPKSSSEEPHANYSIDLITQAYQTLSDVNKKKAYDQQLENVLKTLEEGSKARQSAVFGVFDLEELDFDGMSTWSRSCRCGLKEGYIVTEEDLEEESQLGEVYVGCHGCSLSIKVLFGMVDTEDADEDLPLGTEVIPGASSH